MMRLVLDTGIIVAAIRSSRGPSARLLLAALDGEVSIAATTALGLEYEAAGLRPEHLAAGGLSHGQAWLLIDALFSVAAPVTPWIKLRPGSRDPDDDFVLEAAVNGRVEAIVSHNERDLTPPAAAWGIRVIGPAVVLSELEKRP